MICTREFSMLRCREILLYTINTVRSDSWSSLLCGGYYFISEHRRSATQSFRHCLSSLWIPRRRERWLREKTVGLGSKGWKVEAGEAFINPLSPTRAYTRRYTCSPLHILATLFLSHFPSHILWSLFRPCSRAHSHARLTRPSLIIQT